MWKIGQIFRYAAKLSVAFNFPLFTKPRYHAVNFYGCVMYRMLPNEGKNVENTDTNSFTSAGFTALILRKLTVAQRQYVEIICNNFHKKMSQNM